MIIALERQDSAELAHMFSSDEVTSEAFRKNEMEFLKWLSRAEDNITELGEKEILDNISELYIEYVDEFSKFVDVQAKEDINAARTYCYNKILPLFKKTKAEDRNLLNLNQEEMIIRKNRAHTIFTKATYSTMIVSSAIILIGLILKETMKYQSLLKNLI